VNRERARYHLAWITAFGACLTVYWAGLFAWFQQDDFAWLSLGQQLGEGRPLWEVLLEPKAQGTIRPISERAFFLVLFRWFELDALPYRICVFATQAANMALLVNIAKRMSGSLMVGFLSALFWGVNSSLGKPLSWTSSYNQVLCAFFLLSALACLLANMQTEKRGWLWAQWGLFVVGFGVLEMNVVYPALATGAALVVGRQHVAKTLPLWAASGVYAVVHGMIAQKPESGPYARHYDASLPSTLWFYWTNSFGGPRLAGFQLPEWLKQGGILLAWALTAVLGVYLYRQLRERKWLPVYGLFWWVALIAPVLPLKDHLSHYYLTLPVIGLSMAAGAAFGAAWFRGKITRVCAVLLAAGYVSASSYVGMVEAEFNYVRSDRARMLVLGVRTAHERHPGKTILLQGVTTDQFWSAVLDRPFRLFGFNDVYLAPGAEENIQAFPDLGDVGEFVFPHSATLRLLNQGRAAVYHAGGTKLRNITTKYHANARAYWKVEPARRFDVGHRAFADQLGAGWHEVQGSYRWMSGRAELVVGGPRKGERLHLSGFCGRQLVEKGPAKLTVKADGAVLGEAKIEVADGPFLLTFDFPEGMVGKEKAGLELELDKTFVAEGRELGLVFGRVDVK
jgi:hypothetical protein